jgi:hypothetical protein
MTPDDRAAWNAYAIANKRAADEYAEHPLAMVRDPDAHSCAGCNHLTTHASRYCLACRTYGPVMPDVA